ncbi:MAG: RluA family pseudouridine synthase [Candidatus Dormibacteraceae bacterium]
MARLQRRRRLHHRRGGGAGARVRPTQGPVELTAKGPAARLDRYLAGRAELDLSRSAAARLIRSGLVSVNGRPARVSDPVAEGDAVRVALPPPLASRLAPETIPIRVVYEDARLMVVDKPPGMVVHPSAGHDTGTLVHALLGRGGPWSAAGGEERPGIVHRLDMGTSGLIVVARDDGAHRALAGQLADRTMSRSYLGIARGEVPGPAGELEGAIGRHPRDRQRMAVVEGGRFARTRYEVLERLRGNSLLLCRLDTGRTHQIRVHLAALGHPLAGDVRYGRRRQGDPDRPMLHAWKLSLRHPGTDKTMAFEVAPPADFLVFLESVR